MNLIKELQWRGMIQDIIPGTEDILNKEISKAYIGFDPTGDSLHIGSLIPIMLLTHLKKAGHVPIALVGSATGMIGDPSGKSDERNLLDEKTLLHNQKCIQAQLEKFLPNILVVNNLDWFKGISFLNFIRDIGKLITVNSMMAKDSVKRRIEGENGISFTEFTYQLIQGFDFLWLFENMGCKLQIGGSDQWGNITTGVELIRKKLGQEAFAFTCPLVKKADGGKFGKTESGNVWLDPNKTSPFEFFQFWLKASDDDAENWIKIFTFLDKDFIDNLILEHNTNKNKKILQKVLAEEVTRFVHGQDELDLAIKTSQVLFSDNTEEVLRSLSNEEIEKVLVGVPTSEVSIDIENFGIFDLLVKCNIFDSKGSAKRMFDNGGIFLNKKKLDKLNFEKSDLLNDKFILIQKGKKNYFLIKTIFKINI
jgi:tyrosyl-tRNA synthetase